MALNLFPKLPPIVQSVMLVCITLVGIIALLIGNQEAFNAIIVNQLILHGGLFGQGFYEMKQISQGKILQGVPSNATMGFAAGGDSVVSTKAVGNIDTVKPSSETQS